MYGVSVRITFPSQSSFIYLQIMAMSDSFCSGLSSVDRLVILGSAATLIGAQMIWTAFLAWVLLHFLR